MQTIRKGKRKAPGTIPSVAFGPRGGDGKENVSVVRSTLRKGFTLGMLGEPTEAAQKLLNNAIAPKGSGKEATLLEATKELRGEAEATLLEATKELRGEAEVTVDLP
ncbi:hypothetical protein T484DRAFT_1774582 [Baffinella frigidus]|nr:hypothetical protein T484DRAFT_1774582 [Cryptophyta sp. CCMP2293]